MINVLYSFERGSELEYNGTVEQRWWNSGQSDGGTVEHLMVEQRNI